MSVNSKKSNKKVIIGVAALVAVLAIFAVVYSVFRPKPVEGSKNITIEVVNKEQKSTKYEVKTDAEYLKQAMEEAEGLTFSGSDGMVDTINEEKADYNTDGAYWGFYVNDAYCNYGYAEQPVVDGDQFKIVYTKD